MEDVANVGDVGNVEDVARCHERRAFARERGGLRFFSEREIGRRKKRSVPWRQPCAQTEGDTGKNGINLKSAQPQIDPKERVPTDGASDSPRGEGPGTVVPSLSRSDATNAMSLGGMQLHYTARSAEAAT